MKKNFTYLCLALLLVSAAKPSIKLPKAYAKLFAFIPSAQVQVDGDTLVTQDFYISKTEVSNNEYQTFLQDLKEQNKNDLLAIAFIDSNKWVKNIYNEPYVNYYHSHPAFANYPVVNITYEGALLYCKWLEDKLNTAPNISQKFEVSLPTRSEWIRAASANRIYAVYAWEGYFLKSKKGEYNCNFLPYGAENLHFNPATKQYEVKIPYIEMPISSVYFDYTNLTTHTKAYKPNTYGLYNMNGNVAEMVLEKTMAVGGSYLNTGFDVRNESIHFYSEASPNIGFRPIIKLKQ